MGKYVLTDINGNALGVITLFDDTIPSLIMNDVELVLGGSFIRSKGWNSIIKKRNNTKSVSVYISQYIFTHNLLLKL